jgi:hypothetical protein
MKSSRRRAWALVAAVAFAIAGLGAGACSTSSAGSPAASKSCASDSDCSGGTVCGFANPDGGGAAECSSPPSGVCVVPVDRASTDLCGCGGKPIDIVVDDVDAGVFYWSGVIVGEQGFPPCGDAAIAPSSAADAGADAGTDANAPDAPAPNDAAPAPDVAAPPDARAD